MYRITDVVRHLLIINILVYFASFLPFLGDPGYQTSQNLIQGSLSDFSEWGRYQLAMFYPRSDYFRPWQIVTHMFMHGSFTHLLFNMFALFMFGPPIEMTWGPRRFLFFYLFCGFGALGLYLFVQYLELQSGVNPITMNVPMLGASGAIFGVLAGFGLLFPNSVIQLIFPPIPMKAKYFVIIIAVLELVFGISSFAGASSGVAHFAHVGGALFGLALILYWRKYGTRL